MERASPATRILAIGLWMGLGYGLAEGLEVMLLGLIPGALSWRNGNSANILWFAPLFYGVAFLAAAIVATAIARIFRRAPVETGLVFVLAFGGVFLALTLPGRVLSDLAAAALAAGIATELARQFHRRRSLLVGFMGRTLPHLAGAVLVIGVAVLGFGRIREAVALAGLAEARSDRPNVLLLILDTQRADHLSAYGYHRPTSPRLERFAAEGVLFENAYASSSWTLPAHATLMTGRPLHEHGAGLMRRPYLDDRFPTLAEVLRREGYATGGFVANTFWAGRQTGLARGFVHYEDFWGNLGDAIARTVLGRRLAYDVLPRYGFVDVPGRKWADEVNGDVLRWIDRVGDRPFFAFVNYFDVHGPYLPPAPHAGTFSGRVVSERERSINIGALTSDIVVPAPEKIEQLVDAYDESILYLDAALGRLFDALAARGELDNTVVIITSDHGESWGEHGMMYHGHSLYRDQLHVPLIVRYPAKVPAGRRATRAVSIQQIPRTVLELVGSASTAFGGPSLLENDASAGAPVLAEVGQRSLVAANWPSSRGWLASVLADRWQLTLTEAGDEELFDVVADAAQERNLAAMAEADSVRLRLAEALRRLSPEGGLEWRGWGGRGEAAAVAARE